MAYKYLQRVGARRQNNTINDAQRGLQMGSEFGKLLGGLAGAIKGAQKDQIANKLMNTEDAPRAALVNPGGSWQDTGGGANTGGPQPSQGDTVDPNADLSTDLPEDVSNALSTQVAAENFTNPATGNVEPVQGQGATTDYSGTNTSTNLSDQAASANAASSLSGQSSQPTRTFVPNTIPAGVSTAGTAPHTGGAQEMELQKEMLATQLQKTAGARAAARDAADTADAQAQASGTGRYAIDAALKQAQLAEANQRLAAGAGGTGGGKKGKADAVPPAENVGSEPVVSQAQLNNHIDDRFGKGVANDLASTINAPAKIPNPKATLDSNGKSTDPAIPETIDNPDGVTVNSNGTVAAGPKGHRVTMQMQEAQTLVKQQNALLKKQGLPLLRVPGEAETLGPMIGADAAHPYPAKTNLDIYSRASGTWVKLPDGRVKQVP